MRIYRRIIGHELYVRFVTFSVCRPRKLLKIDHAQRILFAWLNDVLHQYQATCVGFKSMPDHVHARIWFPKSGQLGRLMHRGKPRSSIALRDCYRQVSPNDAADSEEGDRF